MLGGCQGSGLRRCADKAWQWVQSARHHSLLIPAATSPTLPLQIVMDTLRRRHPVEPT